MFYRVPIYRIIPVAPECNHKIYFVGLSVTLVLGFSLTLSYLHKSVKQNRELLDWLNCLSSKQTSSKGTSTIEYSDKSTQTEIFQEVTTDQGTSKSVIKIPAHYKATTDISARLIRNNE